MTAEPRGWFWPSAARKAHFDPGNGIALCGKWGRIGLSGRGAPIDGDETSPASSDDCVECRRRLTKELQSR